MDKSQLVLLACPVCHSKLIYDAEASELVCRNDAMAFPIREGIPVMIPEEARTLTTDERLTPVR